MAAKIYAVLDTNVLVSGMFTGNPSSTTRQILDLTLEGAITPLMSFARENPRFQSWDERA